MIATKVPKCFEELSELVANYIKKYDEADILIDGMNPAKYAEHIMESYERDREIQRSQKVYILFNRYMGLRKRMKVNLAT